MKKIKCIFLVVLAAVSLSSCTLDSASFGVSAVSYPTYRPLHQPAIYRATRYYHYDVRPDWMRYGGNWRPTRRHCRY
tara:strand:+ start:1284 stop:1514 length:231 start_codon:yes stop_codon:yes gene_type:complete